MGGTRVTLQKDPLIAIEDIQGNWAWGQWELSSAPTPDPCGTRGSSICTLMGGTGSPAVTHLPLNMGSLRGAVVFLHYIQLCASGGALPLCPIAAL